MAEKQHYTGLTDAQVAESREKHGVNILTPAEKTRCGSGFSRNSATR